MTLATRIKRLMAQSGMFQSDLAKAMGWSPMTASRVLNGRRAVKDDELVKLASALGVTPELLIAPCDDSDVHAAAIENTRNSNLPVTEAAKLMGKDPQYLRVAIQKGIVPFGFALKGTGSRYVYYISRKQFEEYTGIKVTTREGASDA